MPVWKSKSGNANKGIPEVIPFTILHLPSPGGNVVDVRLYHSDAQSVSRKLDKESVDLIFADPPFNLGVKYDTNSLPDGDNLTDEQYLKWSAEWLRAVTRVLKPGGVLVVAMRPRYQAEIKCLMDAPVGEGGTGLVWRETIIWHYTFGPRQTKKFTPSWVALHVAVKNRGVDTNARADNRTSRGNVKEKCTFNGHDVLVPSARQLKYNDKRAVIAGKVPDNLWCLSPREIAGKGYGLFDNDQNVWLESRVCGTFKERNSHFSNSTQVKHPCQMPIAVLERVIRAYSNPGDSVFDPFVGSGTTCVAARNTGRSSIGCDISLAYLNLAIERLCGV